MSASLLTAVLRALDLCMVERIRSEPSLRLLTPAPIWLAGIFETVPPDVGNALGAPIPFIDHFLPLAEETWHEGEGASASSGPFATKVEGEEVLLLATATLYHDRRLLIFQPLSGDADVRSTLQRAREHALEHERLVRQVGALHTPCAAIDRDTKALLSASLAPDQRALAERLSKASAELQAVLATLPAPPRQRRHARTK